MGGGNTPGRSSSYQTQQTTSTSEPTPTVQPILRQLLGYTQNFLNANPTAPPFYAGATVATPSEATQAAQQTYAAIGSNGLGYGIDPASRTLVADTLGGKYLDLASNPYYRAALSASFQPQTEQFQNHILPGLRSQFEGAGRTGSGADFDTAMRAVKDLDQAQANAAASAANQAYGQERAIQQQTQALLPSMQAMDLARAGALGQAGQSIDAYNHALINEQIARDTYNKTADLNYWSDIAQRVLGMYPGGTTSGSGTSTGYSQYSPPSNTFASLLGTGLGLAGLAAASDKRLKTDIKPVGRLNDGQTVYSYRFRGAPRTEIGLLAQEVEKRHPEAVATHPSGYKLVDYRRATRAARMAPPRAPGGLL
jgi:hypothetical protein